MTATKRDIYVGNTSLKEALDKWRKALGEHGVFDKKTIEIAVDDALGRVTAEGVFAKRSSPFYNAAAMDGIAVHCTDTIGASETTPVLLDTSKFRPVNTGNAIPGSCNAVIMIEDVHMHATGEAEIIKSVTPWNHVRTIGEDIVVTELIVPEGHRIRPIDQGAMLGADVTKVKIRKKPTVMVIPTGSELVQPGKPVEPGNIVEFNSRILAGYAQEWGADAKRSDIVVDDPKRLKMAIASAVDEYDLVITNAGASAGTKDFTADILSDLGEVVVHGVNIKPGKPVILAIVKGKPVIGLPGYPVSAVLTMRLFVKDLLYTMQGLTPPVQPKTEAVLSRPISSKLGVEEFVRVKLGLVGDKQMVTPISRGAGVVMSLVRADGILTVPAGSEGIGAGERVEVELLRQPEDIINTLVFIGSHDNILDVLANILHAAMPVTFLSSAHVGSLGGIMAIKRGDAHIAGTHLLDEDTGEYNIPFIQKYLPDLHLQLINLAYREQGLLVPRGNPKNISGISDLARNDIVFINRQRGAGTRILTDLNLKKAKISPESVQGYDREEYTHMNIASAVASGQVDTGMAIRAAAQALSLDFIPVAKERYDLIIPEHLGKDPKIVQLFNVINHNQEFRRVVEGLGGYDLQDCGKVFYEQ
nr:molybdopterin biosynthesis protein [Desulfobulbaceae bacterium]